MMIDQLISVLAIAISVVSWVWIYFSTRQFNRESQKNSAKNLLINKYLIEGLSRGCSALRSDNYNEINFTDSISILNELKVFLSMYEPDKYKEEYNNVLKTIDDLRNKLVYYSSPENSINKTDIPELIRMFDECIISTYKFLLKDGVYVHKPKKLR